ncbi:MAG: hypothetical protein M3N53_03055 [Actinomycetota bacterium]|nr:hypothetical protein [Actinomycetota bacterium]
MRTAEHLPSTEATEVIVIPEAEAGSPPVAPVWGVLRLLMGFTFFWAFLDKLLALGFATGRDSETGQIDFFGPDAWIRGGSPTDGLLQYGIHTKGPLVGFFQGLAGSSAIEWLFMLSMAGIGLALLFGIAVRVAALGGIAWMVSIYLATSVFPEHNPFVDEHVVYIAVLVGIAQVGAGGVFGLGKRWRRTTLVSRYPVLQ